MSFINEDDRHNLEIMLGGEIPPAIERCVERATQLHSRRGAGPLGIAALSAIVVAVEYANKVDIQRDRLHLEAVGSGSPPGQRLPELNAAEVESDEEDEPEPEDWIDRPVARK